MIHRGARYKVYEPTNTSQLLTCHRWLTRAACRFVLSAEDEEAHLVARADRAAGRRESRYRYGIDHGSALLQRQRAQQQPGQGPGWPSARFASAGASDACTSHARALHAFCFGPRRAPAHDVCAGAHPIRTVVRRRRRPQPVHAQKTRDARSFREKQCL